MQVSVCLILAGELPKEAGSEPSPKYVIFFVSYLSMLMLSSVLFGYRDEIDALDFAFVWCIGINIFSSLLCPNCQWRENAVQPLHPISNPSFTRLPMNKKNKSRPKSTSAAAQPRAGRPRKTAKEPTEAEEPELRASKVFFSLFIFFIQPLSSLFVMTEATHRQTK